MKTFIVTPSSSSPDSDVIFNAQLNALAFLDYVPPSIYYNYTSTDGYGGWYNFEESPLTDNLIYSQNHNGRFHFLFEGLKYYSNISDLWYMNCVLGGYKSGDNPIQQKKIYTASKQSFANINLGVDAMYLSVGSILPAGRGLNEGMFESADPGIRLVTFIDKLDLVERTVTGGKKVNNLQFHFTVKAYLIDPSLGGQYKSFTNVSHLATKSFYYEQTIPTQIRSNFASPTSLKTGWGHFLYPATTGDSTAIKYVQLSDVLKTIYNGMLFSQSTDNASLKIDSIDLLGWLDTDITLKNAIDAYVPSSVTPVKAQPATAFTETNVLKDWLQAVSNEATTRGRPAVDFLLSYDNIYWEPYQDVFSGDVYSNSPSVFMTRLTTYYQGTSQSPVDEPGNFEPVGGFIKARRKQFLFYLMNHLKNRFLIGKPEREEFLPPEMMSDEPEKFLGSKFFPFYKFLQYKDLGSGKEVLDIETIPFSGSKTTDRIIECETADNLKIVLPDPTSKEYQRKITTYEGRLPSSLGSTTTERINSIGFVNYLDNQGNWRAIPLDVNGISNTNYVFSFLTYIFGGPNLTSGTRQWTRNGRYFTYSKDLETAPSGSVPWKKVSYLKLCEMVQSGMYETPEESYKEYKRVKDGIYVYADPSPTDPLWKDYFNCIPAIEVEETTTEYCDPSPSPDGRQIVKVIKKQKVSVAANGNRTNIGDPIEEYPTTTVILKNQTDQNRLGDKTIVYQKCEEISSTFTPYPTTPTDPVSGPKTNVGVSFENFINPAVFNRNKMKLLPSTVPIELTLEKAYYVFEFDQNDFGDLSSDYTLKLAPGTRGQVTILEVNTLGGPFKGLILNSGSYLTTNSPSQRVWLSTASWGDGEGQPVKSFLFLVFDGKNWVEFLRRNIY